MPELKGIDELLLEWESGWRAGKAVTPEELCPDSPELQAELRRRAQMLQQFEAFSDGRTTLDASMSDAEGPPPVIPGYVIRGKLGWGGMGVVYRAWQEDLDREVAVKVMKTGPNIPAHIAKRFAQEARVVARLKHDNLVPIYLAEFNRGQPYFIMELVEGGNLADALGNYANNPTGAAALVEQVARAVHYAHEEGVLHRDLKPANILLDRKGRPRVSDFGLAKLFGEGAEETLPYGTQPSANGVNTLSINCGPMGTPPYMAPEQFRGGPSSVTRQTDVWALGVILYEILTGLRPFGGDYEKSVCEATPRPPRQVRPKLDRGLEAVTLKCLQKVPTERFPTAAEVADELALCKVGLAPKCLHESWPGRVWREVRRRPFALAAAVLTATVFVVWAVAGYVANPQRVQDQIRRDLNDGKLVTLVADTGPPRVPIAWGVGEGITKVSTESDRPFFVSTHDTALVELWHDPPPAFHLRAKVRHDDNPGYGNVGIYFDHRVPGPTVPLPCCYVVGFSDRGRNATSFRGPEGQAGSRVRTIFHYFQTRPNQEPRDQTQTIDEGHFYLPPALKDGLGVWRTLDICVSSGGLNVLWIDDNDKLISGWEVPQPEFTRCAGLLPDVVPELNGYSFNPQVRTAIGLYVRDSAASFRSVTLERVSIAP